MDKLKLSWKDQDGNYQERIFDNLNEATKARNWLIKNNADDVDMAVIVVVKKPEEVIE